MRIVVVISFFGVATTALVGYDYLPDIEASADLPLNSDYPNVGLLELNTFAPTSYVDSYGLAAHTVDGGGGLNKEFYHFTAPEEELQASDASQSAIARIKKNLRVVFIKTPENNAADKVALRLAKDVTSDKTAIYVLSKQPDASEFAHEIKELRGAISHKPEVRFVKYKTPEDAINLQLGIQSQYEALRGPSRSVDEGVTPVLDFSSPPQSGGTGKVVAEDFDGSSLNSYGSTGQQRDDSEGREYIPPVSK